MDISTLGIDLSKTTFHAIGFNTGGEIVLRRKFSRPSCFISPRIGSGCSSAWRPVGQRIFSVGFRGLPLAPCGRHVADPRSRTPDRGGALSVVGGCGTRSAGRLALWVPSNQGG